VIVRAVHASVPFSTSNACTSRSGIPTIACPSRIEGAVAALEPMRNVSGANRVSPVAGSRTATVTSRPSVSSPTATTDASSAASGTSMRPPTSWVHAIAPSATSTATTSPFVSPIYADVPASVTPVLETPGSGVRQSSSPLVASSATSVDTAVGAVAVVPEGEASAVGVALADGDAEAAVSLAVGPSTNKSVGGEPIISAGDDKTRPSRGTCHAMSPVATSTA
jgi:hypothetical protein